MLDLLSAPWPWYVAGPLIGLMVPALLLIGGKLFGISANLRHLCAATVPGRNDFFRYDWKRAGLWNLTLAAGIVLGGVIAATLLASPDPTVGISEATRADLAALGITDFTGLMPSEVFSWSGLLSVPGFVMIVAGGFLVGFGARYAGGCTSGHAITGLADLQVPSLVAVVGFFVGGLIVTHFVLPYLL
ncbi:MAG: YeeE/YedE thiosulfate transporter family protein [Rhodothermales bacterium]|nr:YeeE/YedE thiosulfate transporter family protein [Rhodothermales bacterium]